MIYFSQELSVSNKADWCVSHKSCMTFQLSDTGLSTYKVLHPSKSEKLNHAFLPLVSLYPCAFFCTQHLAHQDGILGKYSKHL